MNTIRIDSKKPDLSQIQHKLEKVIAENCVLREMIEQAAQIFWENSLLPHHGAARDWLQRWHALSPIYGRLNNDDEFTGEMQIR